jgi:hypothetical protein
VKARAPIVSFCATRRPTARFVTVLLPRDTDRDASLALTTEAAGTRELHISVSGATPGRVDRFFLSTDGTTSSAGNLQRAAPITWTRTTDAGDLISFVAGGARRVRGALNAASPSWIAPFEHEEIDSGRGRPQC